MRQTLEHLEPMCDVQEMSVRTQNHDYEDSNTTRTLTCSCCACVDSLHLGFHVVIGVGRLNVQQDGFIRQLHFTKHTQHQVQSSFLLDVVLRLCPVIVNSICIPNSCIFLTAKTCVLRCCLYTRSVTTDRRQL